MLVVLVTCLIGQQWKFVGLALQSIVIQKGGKKQPRMEKIGTKQPGEDDNGEKQQNMHANSNFTVFSPFVIGAIIATEFSFWLGGGGALSPGVWSSFVLLFALFIRVELNGK